MLSALAGTNFKTTIGPPALRELSLHSVALAAGTRLGPYEIVGPLGAGGMGEVHRVRHEAES